MSITEIKKYAPYSSRPEKEPGHPFVIFDPSYLGPPQASSDLDFPRHETAAVAATASMEAAAAVDVSDTGNLVVYQAQSQASGRHCQGFGSGVFTWILFSSSGSQICIQNQVCSYFFF